MTQQPINFTHSPWNVLITWCYDEIVSCRPGSLICVIRGCIICKQAIIKGLYGYENVYHKTCIMTLLPSDSISVEQRADVYQEVQYCRDRKVHGANMGPIWGRQDPGGPHVGPMNFAIWGFSPRPLCMFKLARGSPLRQWCGWNSTQHQTWRSTVSGDFMACQLTTLSLFNTNLIRYADKVC